MRVPCSRFSGLKILIVAENASTRFGGEAILPWHYFQFLRRRGIDVRMIVHARTRDELLALAPDDADRLYFLPDTWINKAAWRIGQLLPLKVGEITVGFVSRVSSQLAARRLARRLVAEEGMTVVHQPIPVSPREPSLLHGMGAPVVIGPMNGNMSFPPAFSQAGVRAIERLVFLGRAASAALHMLMPGKLRAAALLFANERTREALPAGARGRVVKVVENAVDLDLWSPGGKAPVAPRPLRALFIGRLIDLKAVDLLIEAVGKATATRPVTLEILGDGPMRPSLEEQTARLGLSGMVTFSGWQAQAECARRLREADVLVLPSLRECGGAVVLEAMACGLPVVAANWGGPADYVDATCGILVPVSSREALVDGLVDALVRLASDAKLRASLGRAGLERVRREFDWEVKIDRMLDIYLNVASAWQASAADARCNECAVLSRDKPRAISVARVVEPT